MNRTPFTVFGIRHHGPGSTANLLTALHNLNPDCLLVEGPPDANAVLHFAGSDQMKPPVALLVYDKKNPLESAFYPFAKFSPEWQAIRFALAHDIPLQFADLPKTIDFAVKQKQAAASQENDSEEPTDTPSAEQVKETEKPDPTDPLDWFARQAGYEDGEAWWEHAIEERLKSEDLFGAIAELMNNIREQFPAVYPEAELLREQRREAWMRNTIRKAQKEGYQNIAVVCGAWHVPALLTNVKVKDDKQLLRNLPKIKVEATWVPWTYGRLARQSGYGAGIDAPGWYHHLWQQHRKSAERSTTGLSTRWFIRVAQLLRNADLDASSAHVIEAVRLAESLAAIRRRPFPGLTELNDATQAVFCNGERAPLIFVQQQLLIGERMGEIPEGTPQVPLQQDLAQQQRSLRLKPSAATEDIDLDLRKPNGIRRSHLLHRLRLLDIPWGEPLRTDGAKKGTFHEFWRLKWNPEFVVAVVEASIWGTTVEMAAVAKAVQNAGLDQSVKALAELVNAVLLSALPDAVQPVVSALRSRSAAANDVTELMQALPALVDILRYGDVRKSDTTMVGEVVDGLITRVCIGLEPACRSLDDAAAEEMSQYVQTVNHALLLVENEVQRKAWTTVQQKIVHREMIHPLVRGKTCRLLLDRRDIEEEQVATVFALAVSPGNEPTRVAAWLQGFLEGGGMVLLHDPKLWAAMDRWICSIAPERFVELLPLVRRTFSTFSYPERQKIGQRAKQQPVSIGPSEISATTEKTDDLTLSRWGDQAAQTAAGLMGL